MYVHQCAHFCNNPRLVHEHAVRRITNYLLSTSTYLDLPDVNQQLTTCVIVYRSNIYKVSSVTYMQTFPVGGLKQMLIMHKMLCHEQDM